MLEDGTIISFGKAFDTDVKWVVNGRYHSSVADKEVYSIITKNPIAYLKGKDIRKAILSTEDCDAYIHTLSIMLNQAVCTTLFDFNDQNCLTEGIKAYLETEEISRSYVKALFKVATVRNIKKRFCDLENPYDKPILINFSASSCFLYNEANPAYPIEIPIPSEPKAEFDDMDICCYGLATVINIE